jgi:thymidine phosphorylase
MGAGILIDKKIGDYVKKGDIIARLHKGAKSAIKDETIQYALSLAESAVSISSSPVQKPKEILAILDENSL